MTPKINKSVFVIIVLIIINLINAYSLTDSNPSNNVKNISINVFQTQKLNLTFIPIDIPGNFNNNVNEFVKFFNRTYPVSDDNLFFSTGNHYVSTQAERTNLSRLLFNIAKFSAILGTKTRTIGVVPKDWFSDFTNKPDALGLAFTSLGAITLPSGLVEAREMRQIAAHEIGHTFGLCDEHDASYWAEQDIPILFPCPNGDVDDNNILDTDCEPQGCPTTTLGKLVPWNSSNDFINMTNLMGSNYQDKTWISNESYIHLFTKFLTTPLIAQHALIINGIINKATGTINLFPSYIIENAEITQQETNTSGNYSVEIIDNSGITSSKINFTPSFLDIGFNGSTIETNVSYFIVVMNFSSNDKGVKAKENNIVKSEVNRTINTPIVNITSPTNNQIFDKTFTITWNASDLDNDTINYAILTSSDNGATFSTLEIDYPNTTLTINSTKFINSNQYKIKILATDGINTGNDTTETFAILHDQNKFTIKNNTGGNMAWFGDQGNIVIKGTLEQNSNYQATNNFAFKIRNNLSDVLIIENNGSMYIDGTLFENQATIPIDMNKNEFRFKWNGEFKTNINESGYIFTKGTLTQNGNP
ncbi:MAG: hypothetical protein AABX33_06235 [Nanoarchaeota archaeon]